MSKSGDYECTEEETKNFICIDESRHSYISVSDIVGYCLKSDGDKYYWAFYISGGRFFGSENFETEEKALAWFDEKFKPFEEK